MNRRTATDIVAENISAAESAAGVQLEIVYEAPARELTFGDLLNIGGALRVSPALLMKGVPSA